MYLLCAYEIIMYTYPKVCILGVYDTLERASKTSTTSPKKNKITATKTMENEKPIQK